MARRRNTNPTRALVIRAAWPVVMLAALASFGLMILLAGTIVAGNTWIGPGFGG